MSKWTEGKWEIVQTTPNGSIIFPIRLVEANMTSDRIAEIYGSNYLAASSNARLIAACCSESRAIRLAKMVEKEIDPIAHKEAYNLAREILDEMDS